MTCHGKTILTSIPALLCLSFTAAPQSIPRLEVFVYSFPGVSPWVIQEAEKEAGRLLQPVAIELNWNDCNVQVIDPGCASPRILTDLVVRFIPKALPQATTSALGIAGPIRRLRHRVYLLRSRAGLANTDEADACHARTRIGS
jgi:hypothetical protein